MFSTHLRWFTFVLTKSVICVTVNQVFRNSSGQGFVSLSRKKAKTFCRSSGSQMWRGRSEPTRVEFLLRVLLGIGVLFQVVTSHSSVPPRIMSRLVFSHFLISAEISGLLKKNLSFYSTILVFIMSRSCEGKRQKHRGTGLLGITMSFKFSEAATRGVL